MFVGLRFYFMTGEQTNEIIASDEENLPQNCGLSPYRSAAK